MIWRGKLIDFLINKAKRKAWCCTPESDRIWKAPWPGLEKSEKLRRLTDQADYLYFISEMCGDKGLLNNVQDVQVTPIKSELGLKVRGKVGAQVCYICVIAERIKHRSIVVSMTYKPCVGTKSINWNVTVWKMNRAGWRTCQKYWIASAGCKEVGADVYGICITINGTACFKRVVTTVGNVILANIERHQLRSRF